MPSKAFHRFDSRMRAYDADLELADVMIRKFTSLANSDQSLCEALEGDPRVHSHLHAHVNTRASRQNVAVHFKKTFHVAFVKDLYEDFSEYLSTSLSRAALAGVDAARFSGEAKLDLHAAEILRAGSWDAVIRLISDKIFRALENERSTITLITKISNRIGLQLEANILAEAMPYLDARHILIHRDGKPDDVYTNAYPDIAVINGSIAVNYPFVKLAREKVMQLAEHIDTRLSDAGFIRPQDIHGNR